MESVHRSYRWLFRISLFVGLLTAVVTVIYFTPIPDLYFASCDRPCHDLDWPMICRFKLTFELHQTMGGWCGDCPSNISHCLRTGCIVADGSTKRIMAVNKQLPGPSIQVCERDILVVDVVNRVPGQSVSIHWRGQRQMGTPYMDGVPMVTQCPITTYTTFQYKFRASHHGTHLWHAQTGNELVDGLFGAVVVRRADKTEQARHLYDYDLRQHVLVINEWKTAASENKFNIQILVNGVSSQMEEELIPRLLVDPGKRYRIRVAYAGSVSGCPVFISVQGHPVLVIALDGNYVSPRNVSAVHITTGERVDFIVSADKEPGEYSLTVASNCTSSIGLAKIEYNTTFQDEQEPSLTQPHKPFKLAQLMSTVTSKICDEKGSGIICLPRISSRSKLPPGLAGEVDKKLYLPFDIVHISGNRRDLGDIKPRLNNITFIFPPSPMLSQPNDIMGSEIVCRVDKKPKACLDNMPTCECVHLIEIPLNSKVELILVDQDKETKGEHVFHLHGYKFYVVGVAQHLKDLSIGEIKEKDAQGALIQRNFESPPVKDTVTVPKGGAVAIRFLADNPGYWLLHDQSPSLWASGLDVVLRVGEQRDLPALPSDFPTCGNWIGPDFFLI